MKCRKCVNEGLKSILHSGECTTTLMGFSPYWDEDGNEHVHNPNRTTQSYSCSNGHRYIELSNRPCPTCDKGKRGKIEILFL